MSEKKKDEARNSMLSRSGPRRIVVLSRLPIKQPTFSGLPYFVLGLYVTE